MKLKNTLSAVFIVLFSMILTAQTEKEVEVEIVIIDNDGSEQLVKSDGENEVVILKDLDFIAFHSEIDKENIHFYKLKSEDSNRAFLGITPAQNIKDIDGVMVHKVHLNTSAERLGLQTGDIIYQFNQQKITRFPELVTAISMVKPDDTVHIKYRRDGKKIISKGAIGRRNEVAIHNIIKKYNIDTDYMDAVDIHKNNGTDDILFLEIDTGNKEPIHIKLYDKHNTLIHKEKVKQGKSTSKKKIEIKTGNDGPYYLVLEQNGKIIYEGNVGN